MCLKMPFLQKNKWNDTGIFNHAQNFYSKVKKSKQDQER